MLRQLTEDEIIQRREEGCDVSGFEDALNALLPGDIAGLEYLYRALDSLAPKADCPYVEPSTFDGIRAARPEGVRRMEIPHDDEALLDRIYGAWLGRCAGCTLGKPVQPVVHDWNRRSIEEYLRLADAYPLDDYFPVLDPFPDRLVLYGDYRETTRGNIKYMARDDDIDYTILGLRHFEDYGLGFRTEDVASSWLSNLPYMKVYTAERAAYRNLVNGIRPPQTARYRNPYREWIGAQIRADTFGYAAPGWPEKAAEFAFRDAAVSHVKNGIYGEMWVAATLAAALVSDDLDVVFRAGLAEIPAESRLSEAVRDAIEARHVHSTWGEAWDALMVKYGRYDWDHTINNAVDVVLGLLYGGGDFGRTICITVMGGFDSDCSGATAGSIIGALLGASSLPRKWVAPLNDRVTSFVIGESDNRISDLAQRTLAVAKEVLDLDHAI